MARRSRAARVALLTLASALAPLLAACGGSSDDPAPTTEIAGSVFAAPVSGATVTVRDAAGAVVGGPVTTGADGSYRVRVLDSALGRALRFEATGGTYTDEASQASVTTGLRLAARVALGSAIGAGGVHLTPASTIQHDLLVEGGLSEADAARALQNTFGFVPDVGTAPRGAGVAGATYAERLAAQRAAVFSHLTKAILPGAPEKQPALLAAIARDLRDGKPDAVVGGSVDPIVIDGTKELELGYAYTFAQALGEAGSAAGLSGTTVQADRWTVEYVKVLATERQGPVPFRLVVTTAAGAPAAGVAVAVKPLMFMATKNHSAPVEQPVESATPGTYDATVYFQMGSGPSMGFWELQVTVGEGAEAETFCFHPDIAMAMSGVSTPNVRLVGPAGSTDVIAGATAGTTAPRPYLLFNDGLSMDKTTLRVFLAAPDDAGMMSFPAVSAGSALHLADGTTRTVGTVKVEATQNDGVDVLTATPVAGAPGHYDLAGLTGVGGTTAATVKLRLAVDGEVKLSGTAEWAPFTFAASGGMGGM